MKSFIKFILFIVIWMVVYYYIGRFFNWGIGLLGNALNLDTVLGKLILISVCSSVMWGLLFYPTVIIGTFFLDKTVYATISMIIMIILNAFIFYVYCQFAWYMAIPGIVHAASTIIPLWGIKIQLKQSEDKLKEQQEAEYKEKLKAEIIDSLQNER